MGVHETGFGLVRGAVVAQDEVTLGHRLAGHRPPLFPLAWALWLAVGVQQQAPADGAATLLRHEQTQGDAVHRQGWAFAPPIGPVLGQRGVVWRRPALDQLVSDDPSPGELA